MATLETTKLNIAGRGHVLHAPVDTRPLDLDAFVFGDESTYGNWTWIGDTSSENLVEIENDGGDVTYKRTWDRVQVRAVRDEQTTSATINSVNVSGDTFTLGFNGAVYDEALDSYKIGANVSSSARAILIVIEDGTDVAGLYLPDTDTKGAFPTFDLEEFTEIPLNVAVLGSVGQVTTAGPLLWEWFVPRPYTGGGAVEVPGG